MTPQISPHHDPTRSPKDILWLRGFPPLAGGDSGLGIGRSRHPGTDAYGWRQESLFSDANDGDGWAMSSRNAADRTDERPGGEPTPTQYTRHRHLHGYELRAAESGARQLSVWSVPLSIRIPRAIGVGGVSRTTGAIAHLHDRRGRSPLYLAMGI